MFFVTFKVIKGFVMINIVIFFKAFYVKPALPFGNVISEFSSALKCFGTYLAMGYFPCQKIIMT